MEERDLHRRGPGPHNRARRRGPDHADSAHVGQAMTSKASGRVLYLNPMDYGTNPGVDAIAHGLHHRLETSGLELRVVFNDFSRADWRERAASTIDAAIAAKFRAVVIYVLDPMEPAAAVARARKAGLQVFSFERPRFPVDGSLVYPNFNQGTYMAEHLADRLRTGAAVAVVAGPLGDVIVRHLASSAVDGEDLALGPIGQMIDASNVARWKAWSERIPFAPLAEGLGDD